ncbi:MAG: AAA family ATPase, partial [Nanoarchaeota archaeon]|nr:AAA family ATPase [Nanoarchaeota archaeon]
MRKNKVIVVSGTPATGKTELAKLISKELRYKYLDVNQVIKENNLCEDYDKARHCNVVDINKLSKALIKIITSSKESLVIDSHMAHFLPKEYIDLVIITKCGLKALKERLEKRDYPDAKIRENLDAEIFDI